MNRINFCFVFALLATVVVAEQFSYKFTLPTNLVTINSVVNGSSLRLTSPYVNYAGLAYYPTKVSANLGFSTNFTWVPESCSTPTGAEGFSFFLTKDAPTWQQVSASVGAGLGISNVPNMYMVGYSASAGQLYVCDWTTPLTTTFALSPQCSVTNVGQVQCGGRMTIKIDFDGTFWNVYNNNALLATITKGIDLEHYFVGLSGSTGTAYFKQSITQWSFRSTTGNFVDASVSPVTSSVYYLGTAVPTSSGSFQLTTGTSQAGAVVYNQQVVVKSGFKTQFTWAPSNCDTQYGGADGFTFFAGLAVPTNYTVQRSQGSGLGVQYMWGSSEYGNFVMTAYSATFNEFYICNWTDPRPDYFRYVCYTVVNPTPKLTCGANYSIEVTYLGNQLSMSVDGVLKIASTNVVFGKVQYSVGISGATGAGWFQQDIYDWSFRYNDVSAYGGVYQLEGGIGSATSNSTITTLTNGPNQSGAIFNPGSGYVSYKFELSFTWSGFNCVGAPSRGFSHFFSRLAPTASQIQTTPDELGIGNVADVYMMGYDVRNGNLLLCDWGAPPTGFSPSICTMTPMPLYVCGTSLNFKMTYDSLNMKVYVNDTLKLTRSVTIYPRSYYSGFTGLTTNSYMTQQVSNYAFFATYVNPTSRFEYGLPNSSTLFGGASEAPGPYGGKILTLTNGYYGTENAGLMLSATPITMKYGFEAGGAWNASNCDSVYSGGNGFAFVFTKNVPNNSTVPASSGDGLGIQQVPDVTMIGYSSYYNEFYICSWVSPLSGSYRNNPACQTISNSAINPLHPQRLTCNEYSFFTFNYDSYNFRLTFYTFNGVQSSVDLVSTGPFPLDLSSSYYFGMSGSVGNGYYEQVSNYIYVRGFN